MWSDRLRISTIRQPLFFYCRTQCQSIPKWVPHVRSLSTHIGRRLKWINKLLTYYWQTSNDIFNKRFQLKVPYLFDVGYQSGYEWVHLFYWYFWLLYYLFSFIHMDRDWLLLGHFLVKNYTYLLRNITFLLFYKRCFEIYRSFAYLIKFIHFIKLKIFRFI